MKRTALALLTLLACSRSQPRPPPTAEVVLTVEGRLRGSPVQLDLAGLHGFEQRTLRGHDPRAPSELSYEGTSLAALVRELDPKREVDLAVVHGASGYAVAVPLPAIRQYRPVLAEKANGRPVAEAIGEDAGRLVLAWPNSDAPGFDIDPRTRWWWARDVKRIELVPWYRTYGRALRVPAGAGDDARRGADAFANSCIHCHRLRGVGGERGPDLSAWTPSGGPAQLLETVRAHASRFPELKGVDLTRGVPEIAAFLEAVRSAGPPLPGDEPPEEKQDEPKQEEMPPTMPPMGPYGVR